MSVIKRSPIILIRLFLFIELGAVVLYLLGTLPDPKLKYQIYSALPFAGLFSYETLKFVALSLTQFIITIYAFLRWYRDYYAIGPGSITHFWGAFLTKQQKMSLGPSTSFIVRYNDPIGKLKFFHYGSIEVSNANGEEKIILSNIPWPERSKRILQEAIKENNPAELLKRPENERLEFKSTLRFDHKSGLVNRELERSAMKTVAAFMNSKGGQLILGVDDSRNLVGLASDYKTLHRPTSDGFENHFTQLFNSMIGPEFRHLIKLTFHKIEKGETCLVETMPSSRPVYLKIDDNEHFYVRTGNVSTPLKLSEVEQYSRSRWPKRILNS